MKAWIRHDVSGRSILIVSSGEGVFTLFGVPYNLNLVWLEVTTENRKWYPGATGPLDEPEEFELPDKLGAELLTCCGIGDQPMLNTITRLRQLVLAHRGAKRPTFGAMSCVREAVHS